ncbi:adenylate/guanylate cyclase domain-containing protein [Terrimonas alba]|uniref:adenylate/guanylate cyclase domain-containing protein n=1 Tax=Terrimonas alba TaxID=3349636 RepID=UPI0035F492DF
MKRNNLLLWVALISFSINGLAQPGAGPDMEKQQDTVLINNLIQQSTDQRSTDPDKSLELALQAKELAEKVDFKKGEAYAYKNIGLAYLVQSKYIEALQNYEQSLKIFEDIKYDEGIANLLGNIGVIYYYQGDMVKALDYYLRSLKIAERTGNKLRIMPMLNNVGAIYGLKPDTYDKALQYYLQALPICEELGDKDALGGICVNVGDIYADSAFKQNDDEKALEYFNKALKAYGPNADGSPNAYNAIGKLYLKQGKYEKALNNHSQALAISEKLNDKLKIVQSLIGLAKVYSQQNDYKTAISYFKKAEPLAVEIQSTNIQLELYGYMSKTYADAKDFGKAYAYHSLYGNVKDTVYNNETDKKLTTIQFDFDLEKKQNEINLLTKDNALNELQLRRQKLEKTALTVVLVLVFLIAILILRNNRIKARTNKILDRQKDEIEHLLLNILPAEVAKELQVNGTSAPRNYESVSVMFTDFKGFTSIADKVSPQELIEELNACFLVFDNIIEKYDLEKIKTIGDSYMCAGGVPTPDDQHVFKIVKASLEIQQYITENNIKRRESGLAPWDLRIGIHVGPVVAGVVGKKKYAYDIWGSTVNIASRMESNGEPGQVNVSSAVYDIIQEKYACAYRGKIYAKNVGEVDMYFVQYEKPVIIHPMGRNESSEYSLNDQTRQQPVTG